MPSTTRFDALQFVPLEIPYDSTVSPLDDRRVFVDGHNLLVEPGGTLRKRPGLTGLPSSLINMRCDRLWAYETMEPTPRVYILGSFYDQDADRWKLYYWRAGSPGWTALTGMRSVDNSTRPHEVCVSRGLAFIKSFPPSDSDDKLGTCLFDGTVPELRLWGILGPNDPAGISGVMTSLSADIGPEDTTMTITNDPGFPQPPFVVLIDYELINVTAVNGTTLTVERGFLNTPVSAHRDKSKVIYRDWNPSDHNITVNHGWKYTYAYKTKTDGHVSNRAPLQENPDKMPSSTLNFFDQVPKLLLTDHPDTTNVPNIVVFRTTDGGGTFYYLETVTNPGLGTYTYFDDSLESGAQGGTFNDPVHDQFLDTTRRSPSLTSNSPPPTVLLPKILGVDTPEPSTRIVAFANRLWYAIGNVLFFSAQEELDEGVPEHAWPSGATGNFYKLTEPVVNLEATTESLWVLTPTTIYRLTGTNRETFALRPYYKNIGGLANNPESIVAFKNRIAAVTSDLRVVMFSDSNEPVPIFNGLGDAIRSHVLAGHSLKLSYFAFGQREWLVLSAHSPLSPNDSRYYVLDLRRQGDFLNVPWYIPANAAVISKTSEQPTAPDFVVALWDGSNTRLARIDLSKTTDINPTTGADVGFGYGFSTYLVQVPPGNHINALRRPAMYPKVQRIELECNTSTSPTIEYFPDRLVSSGNGIIGTPEAREYLAAPGGFVSHVVPVDHVCYRLGIKVTGLSQHWNLPVEIYSLNIIWYPEAGI